MGPESDVRTLSAGGSGHFSSVARPMASNKTTRRTIAELIESILNELELVKESTDYDLRVSLYEILFNCCADTNDWTRGSKVVAEAFQRVPVSHQKSLWEAKVIFDSKLGKDVAAGLHRMKSNDRSVQARAWITLARSSLNADEQRSTFDAAKAALKGSFLQVDVLIEFAEWLYANNEPRRRVRILLVKACSILLDAETSFTQSRHESAKELLVSAKQEGKNIY